MIRWYLARHGRTELNRDNRVQGLSQSTLDEEGLTQARKLRDRLAGETFTAAFCSDLMRARQTAQIILGDHKTELITSPDLRELDYGVWDTLTLAELKNSHSDEMSRMMDGDHDFAPPGGESVTQLLKRTGHLVAEVQKRIPQGNLLVVCHGGSLRGLVIHLLGLPVSSFWSLQVDLASLSIIDIYPNRPVLVLFNDTSHLRYLS